MVRRRIGRGRAAAAGPEDATRDAGAGPGMRRESSTGRPGRRSAPRSAASVQIAARPAGGAGDDQPAHAFGRAAAARPVRDRRAGGARTATASCCPASAAPARCWPPARCSSARMRAYKSALRCLGAHVGAVVEAVCCHEQDVRALSVRQGRSREQGDGRAGGRAEDPGGPLSPDRPRRSGAGRRGGRAAGRTSSPGRGACRDGRACPDPVCGPLIGGQEASRLCTMAGLPKCMGGRVGR